MTSTEPEVQAAAIAAQLGETAAATVAQIQRAIECCGPESIYGLLAETLEIEAKGGQQLADGSRRRTPGGIFFALLRAQVSPDAWRQIRGVTGLPAPIAARPLEWADRAASAGAALAAPGAATSVRLTVIGQPREVKARENLMILTLDGGEALPPLPHGLPCVERAATTYRICLVKQDWRRVEHILDAPRTMLVAEGYPVPNTKTGSVTLLARSVKARPAAAEISPGVMRLQLLGQPGAVIRSGLTRVAAFTSRRASRLPAEFPPPPPVACLVYSAEKQWKPLEAGLQLSPDAVLRIDGFGFYDPEIKGLAVLAQSVNARAGPSGVNAYRLTSGR